MLQSSLESKVWLEPWASVECPGGTKQGAGEGGTHPLLSLSLGDPEVGWKPQDHCCSAPAGGWRKQLCRVPGSDSNSRWVTATYPAVAFETYMGFRTWPVMIKGSSYFQHLLQAHRGHQEGWGTCLLPLLSQAKPSTLWCHSSPGWSGAGTALGLPPTPELAGTMAAVGRSPLPMFRGKS